MSNVLITKFIMIRAIVITITICYLALITYLSTMPLTDDMKSVVDQNYGSDKLLHFSFYFILNFLLLTIFCIGSRREKATLRSMIGITLISVGYSIFIEYIQHLIGREFSIYDVMANTIGAIIALVVFQHKRVNDLLGAILTK